MHAKKVLIVEDEELMRSILRRLLENAGYDVLTADSAENALNLFRANKVALTLTDIKMSGMDGIELLDNLKDLDEEALVIVMTAFSSVDSAVAALRKGAYDYITKPFVNEDLLQTVKNALAQGDLFRENRALRRELDRYVAGNFREIIGKSGALRHALSMVEKVADTSATVLISGESGTGKELIARALHFNSARAAKPFLAVNCGALPESILESELFGYEKGAFTGADAAKKGLFRSAEGGTLFLDEIAEMPLRLQVNLLRALQEQEVLPLGRSAPVAFDARIVAATNRDLSVEVEEGRFREDLYYRLNVIEITLPPLRKRPEDIPMLARYFCAKTAHHQSLPEKSFSSDALAALRNYDWPGNVRELENAIERAFILSGAEIDIDSLPPKLCPEAGPGLAHGEGAWPTLESIERQYIFETLDQVGQDKIAAARILGIDVSTLYRKLKRFQEE
jgi:DNA-binding NtrC family response regulator